MKPHIFKWSSLVESALDAAVANLRAPLVHVSALGSSQNPVPAAAVGFWKKMLDLLRPLRNAYEVSWEIARKGMVAANVTSSERPALSVGT